MVLRHGILPLGLGGLRSLFSEKRDLGKLGDAITRILQHAGPAFIRIGQILSTQEDLFPAEICRALAKLNGPQTPMSRGEREAQLRLAYPDGLPFRDFEAEPFWVGVLAQMHRVRLVTGAEAAVKILRPGLRETLPRDIEAIRWLIRLGFARSSATVKEWLHATLKLLDDLAASFWLDMDLSREPANLEEFRRALRGRDRVLVPRPFPEFSTPLTLVLDEVRGTMLSELVEAHEMPLVLRHGAASTAVKEIAAQILDVGVFHPDPHGGNLLYTEDGRIAFVEVPQLGRFSREDRGRLVKLLQSFLRRDEERILNGLLDFFDPPPEGFDARALMREIREEAEAPRHLGIFAGRVLLRANRHHLTMSPQTVLLVRSLLDVQTLSRSLDPDFSIARAALPTVLASFVPDFLKGAQA